MICPDCWHEDSIGIDYTPGYNINKPYEIVCYYCGWFSKRFKTREEAEKEVANED